MSRIGKSPITVPQGVEVTLGKNNAITTKGPKGELSRNFHADMIIKMEENVFLKLSKMGVTEVFLLELSLQ